MAWDYSSFEKSEVKGRLAGALFAASWAVLPGFGVIDLSVTVQPTGEWLGRVPLNAGWGLLTTVLLGSAFAWCVPDSSPSSRSRSSRLRLH
jgi:hypothetical protein